MSDLAKGPEEGQGAERSRVNPYDLVVTDHFETTVFPTIIREGQQHAVDPIHPDRFQLLAAVGDAVRDVVPAEAPPEALEQYRALLYHVFNYWRYEKCSYLLAPAVARYLVEAAPAPGDWELALPHPSVYLQLPTNLFWGSITPDATPEPLDGFFVAAAEGEDAHGQPFKRIAVLAVLGVRRSRAGFSVIPFETESGPGIATEWSAAAADDDREDFHSTLPGGEISGLYSVLTTREVLKLLGRALWYIDSFPEEITPLPDRPGHLVGLGGGAGEGA